MVCDVVTWVRWSTPTPNGLEVEFVTASGRTEALVTLDVSDVRLEKGALPTAEILKLGGQIADALDRAHRAGVIHRDLKPGNVMLTKSGAKLMDFGLARATGMAGQAAGSGVTVAALTHSPTMAAPLTVEGTIVGTFQYMAPEQLEGKEANERSDLWALGCVLYEMVTGKHAFDGATQASLISAIMRDAVLSMADLSPMSPPALERLVNALLAKDPDDRVQSAHDVRLQLSWIAAGGSQAGAPAVAGMLSRSRSSPQNSSADWQHSCPPPMPTSCDTTASSPAVHAGAIVCPNRRASAQMKWTPRNPSPRTDPTLPAGNHQARRQQRQQHRPTRHPTRPHAATEEPCPGRNCSGASSSSTP